MKQYIAMPTEHIAEAGLSLSAKGLLTTLLSELFYEDGKDSFEFDFNKICKASNDNYEDVVNAFNELIRFGFIKINGDEYIVNEHSPRWEAPEDMWLHRFNNGRRKQLTNTNADRNKPEYFEWRIFVYERDNYTCQICGKRGGELNAHHIKPWSKFPDLRFSVDNGVTLCKKCHKYVHRKRKLDEYPIK